MRGKFKLRDDYVYKMPAHFGGTPFNPWKAVYGDMLCFNVRYETDQEALLQYLPEVFELREPILTVQYSNCRDVVWMSGGEYRLIQVTVPVKFTSKSEELYGDYALVVWENKTCPIIGGREEDGVPKVFADIANERHVEDHWFTFASYESCTFLGIDFYTKKGASPEDMRKMNEHSKINLFGWRYLPNLGKGGATVSQATLYPQEITIKQAWYGEGRVQWTMLTPERHPLQSHVIKSLSELPAVNYIDAMMFKCSGSLNGGYSKTLL
ncbi:MAG: acetoacetate decarboxylase family protein [Thermotogaceae bacterium]|nr:acetoacetate decarboxylase family protein [Thermotogaceae bacterium]